MEIIDSTDVKSSKNLLVFKGKRYIYGIGSETRNSLHHLHNNRDILIYTTCKHGKKWKDFVDERCEEDNKQYDKLVFELFSFHFHLTLINFVGKIIEHL